jgi:hypothetical protein
VAWRDPVIDYCERQGHGFWSEPVNALTNIAFLLAAAAAFALWRRRRETDYPALALIVVTALVGVGSFIFHTVATRGAMLFDVVPIAVFIYGYFLLALRRFFGLGALASTAITLLFAAGSYLVEYTFHGLHGSVGYLPALGAMICFAALLWPRTRRRQTADGLALAALVFAASLTFRTMDGDVCAAFPLGTHFLWHILNACVLWLLLRTAMLHAEPREPSGSRLTISGDSEAEGQRPDRGVGENQRPDVAREKIGGGPGEAREKSVGEQHGIAIGVVHQRKNDGRI